MGETSTLKTVVGKDLTKAIKGFKFEPSFNRIITTVNRRPNEKGIVTTEGGLDEIQFVVAAGETSKYKPGDKVVLDFNRLSTQVADPNNPGQAISQINVTPFVHDETFWAIMFDNDILGKYTK